MRRICIVVLLVNLAASQVYGSSNQTPLIFPLPMEVRLKEGTFTIDKLTSILLPEKESKEDDFLSSILSNELADRYGQAVNIVHASKLPDDNKFILIGSLSNPLLKDYCKRNGLLSRLEQLGDEGYIISVSDDKVVVAANTRNGALYGVESLRQIIQKNAGVTSIPQLVVIDKPQYSFRGLRMYLPGRENIPFFKRFVKDFMALYKYNKIILEVNANMRLDRHPEMNIGTIEFARYLNYNRFNSPSAIHTKSMTSAHHDTADGEILEKAEVADLISYLRKFNIEVIPEIPALSHAYYLLFGHPELAENMDQKIPDTYCPLRPEVYDLYFDVLDEYIEVIQPSMIHVGHDEWRIEKDLCKLCRGKDYGELFANDLVKIHDYLAGKGIRTAIWADHLLESVRGKDYTVKTSSTGSKYRIPGALSPEEVVRLIPKDILVFNWSWGDQSGPNDNDKRLSDFGFEQVYGNLRPHIGYWEDKADIKGLSGGSTSSWAATTEKNFGKDLLYDFLGVAQMLWSSHYLPIDTLAFPIESLLAQVHRNLSGKILPSDNGVKVNPVDISRYFNSTLTEGIVGLKTAALLEGEVKVENKVFHLNAPTSQEKRAIVVSNSSAGSAQAIDGIKINEDVSSLIFLHACAKQASNDKAHRTIYNFDDTSELLGWYEVVYEDGFIETIPLRYGVNIMDWRWRQRIRNREKDIIKYGQHKHAYRARAVDCAARDSDPVTFFAFEWRNPRFGKKIMKVNLKTVTNDKANDNAIILLAISASENKRKLKHSVGHHDQQ